MLELLIDNRNGNVWDISELASSLTYKTKRIGASSSIDLTLAKGAIYQDQTFKVQNGDIIRFRTGDADLFYGYVFNVSHGSGDDVSIQAYDQIRYLLANDTYVFKNVTASQVVKRIASDLNLETGLIEDTGYVIPSMLEDNQKLLDIINKALDLTLINGGGNFALLDDFGKLSLRNVENMVIPIVVGDESLLFDYSYEYSIDNDTYNRVKLVYDNQDTGKREVYIGQDSANVARWGRLQLYQVADSGMNEAQIKELLDNLLAIKNREQKKLQLQAIGDVRVRAGCYVPVVMKELGIAQYFLVDECTHAFEGNNHTMTLGLKVI